MDLIISNEELTKWCSYKPEEILAMDDLNARLEVRETAKEYYDEVADLMIDEINEHNAAGKITKWIMPAGPTEQWERFTKRVNEERISLKNLWIFMMDEYLDWEGRLIPETASYGSLHKVMKPYFAGIDPELMCPPEQIIWPDINDIDAYDAKVEEMGGIDTIWAGVGCKGLVAFCEAPHSRYYRISQEEYKNSKTRIVELNEDTLVALAERRFGGYYDKIPPKAVTIGMKSILSSKRMVCMLRMGSWKQTVLRIMLLCKDTTLEYPVTFAMKYIPEKIIYTDAMTLEHPLSK